MHKTRAEAPAFARSSRARIGDGVPGRELVLAPAFTALAEARDPRGRWSLACQNVAAEPAGAFTGEVSARQAADAGCRYAIVGHSERRRLFGEDGPTLAKKLARCREAGLTPIYCVGETAEERDAGLTASTLARQVDTLAAIRRTAARRRLRAGLGDRHRPRRDARGRRAAARAPRRRCSPRGAPCASSTGAP